MTHPLEPQDDGPVDPNTDYAVPPWGGQYLPPPAAPAPPPHGYPGSYPPPWDTGRPAGLMGASVLGYIDAGLLILAGLLLLIGASAVDSWNNAFGSSDHGFTAELTIDGLINLLAAGLQIVGGVMMSGRAERGRTLFSVGAGLCIVAGIYWMIRAHDGSVAIWAAVFIALPVIGLAMSWTAQATAWLRGIDPRVGGPARHPGG